MSPVPRIPARFRPRGITFLYEDRDVIVVDKAPGVLTTQTRHCEKNTAEEMVSDYLRKGNARSSKCACLVHRLDRETSGLLLFAKSEEAMIRLKDNWGRNEKLYLALVKGTLPEQEGVFESELAEDEDLYVSSVPPGTGGKFARTGYQVIRETAGRSAVRVRLFTGRKNQIRVHFSENGHPVVGDVKYGGGRSARLFLHAKVLAFDQPFTGERLRFETLIPASFCQACEGLQERDWREQ